MPPSTSAAPAPSPRSAATPSGCSTPSPRCVAASPPTPPSAPPRPAEAVRPDDPHRREALAQQGREGEKVSSGGGELASRRPRHNPPRPSASGRTGVVASTRGNQGTEAVIDGRPVVVGVNAYIPRHAR